jgi:hypothetical protein
VLSPFVGRKSELERLHASLAAAGDGHGGLVVLVGPAGIGKTRCVEESIARLELPPGRILRGRSSEQAGAPAFWPWRRALRPFFTRQADAALRDSLGLDAAALAALIPELRTRLPEVSRDAAADPQEGRFALLEGVSSWLLRAAASEPLVVFLDDIQWADASSLELLALLAPDLAESHATLLCTWREPAPRAADTWLPRLRRVGEIIQLPGLDLGETSALVRQRATTAPPEAWIAWLHRKTAGNPFFVDEIVRVWSARGGLATDASGDDPAPPESMREVVRGHLAPLPDDVRAWLALGAVLGQEFDVALLAAASACDAEAVLGGLAPALELNLVEAVPGTQRFRFVHALIAETLYGDLSPRERATLHRKVGVAIEAGRDRLALPVAELAYHFYRAAPLPWMVGENGERLELDCPDPCREALAKGGGVLLPGSGEPGIGAEWVLRMPLGEGFDLGPQSLTTRDVFSQEPHRVAIESRRVGDRDLLFPANLRVTLVGACPARVRVGAVARLRFYEHATIPIPRGFEIQRWLQMNGCDELARGFPD